MATAEVIILSSPPHHKLRPFSSSPSLPSPSFVLRPQTEGIKATDAWFRGVSTHSATAATITDLAVEVALPSHPGELDGKLDFGLAKAGKSVIPEISDAGATVAIKRTMKAKPTEAGKERATKQRKSRAKKPADVQTKLKAGKVTKPGQDAADPNILPAKKPRKKRTSAVAVVASKKSQADAHEGVGDEPSSSLQLKEAVRRRADWTPAKDTVVDRNLQDNDATPDDGIDQSDLGNAKGFGNLFGSFGYKKDEVDLDHGQAESLSTAADEGKAKKRRRVMTIKENAAASSDVTILKEKKAKAPKRKAKTITDQAIAQLAIDEPPLEPLLRYLVPELPTPGGQSISNLEGSCVSSTGVGELAGLKAPTRKTATLTKPAQRKSRKKVAVQQPVLLSPASALKKANGQDLVFGTSSQLVREDSPTVIREIHRAMEASMGLVETGALMNCTADRTHYPLSVPWGAGNAPTSNTYRSLWAAAARDQDGSLMSVDVLDLAGLTKDGSSQPKAKIADTTRAIAGLSQRKTEPEKPLKDDWNRIEEEPQSVTLGSPSHALPRPDKAQAMSVSEPSTTNQKARGPASKNKQTVSTKSAAGTDETAASLKPAELTVPPSKPDFAGYPTTQLTREIASYGFKPVKNRTQMIALLDKCWEGKHRAALKALESNAQAVGLDSEKESGGTVVNSAPNPEPGRSKLVEVVAGNNPPKPPTKPRGRPRKDAATSNVTTAPASPKAPRTPTKKKRPRKAVIEEISDSDTPPTPSPPRSKRRSPVSALPCLHLSGSDGTVETDASSSIHESITRAVTRPNCSAFSSSITSSTATFHEQILLYQPIVLEDLATWLNTEGLSAVDVDEEVGLGVVRTWCESRGVCCFSRDGWGGRNVRKNRATGT